MEFPNLGKHCAVEGCHLLDFLPLKCNCSKNFCCKHFDAHFRECNTKDNTVDYESRKKLEGLYVCSHPNCGVKDILPLICENCKVHFCIKHRHFADCSEKSPGEVEAERQRYVKPVKDFEEAKKAVDEQIESNLKDVKKKQKNKQLANKIQLMRLKNKATGPESAPVVDRIYFNLTLPKFENVCPIFVSKQWSVGKVVDELARKFRLQNNNNLMSHKQLKLFKKDDGNIITKKWADTMQFLIQEEIITEGENLTMEYVDNDCFHL